MHAMSATRKKKISVRSEPVSGSMFLTDLLLCHVQHNDASEQHLIRICKSLTTRIDLIAFQHADFSIAPGPAHSAAKSRNPRPCMQCLALGFRAREPRPICNRHICLDSRQECAQWACTDMSMQMSHAHAFFKSDHLHLLFLSFVGIGRQVCHWTRHPGRFRRRWRRRHTDS